MYFNIIRTIYDKLTASIILNSEMLKAFLLRSKTKNTVPILTTVLTYTGNPSQRN